MRIFALSDMHVDFEVNQKWVEGLSRFDYRDDLLILAGDVTDNLTLLEWCLSAFVARFRKVMFVPGNHDLWVIRDGATNTSLQKFLEVMTIVEACGVSTRPIHERGVSIVPLLGWYDYSFGLPCHELEAIWMDFRACRWPVGMTVPDVARHFASLNDLSPAPVNNVITFSHFLPRIDLMPYFIPPDKRILYPVFGSANIDNELRQLKSRLHVYGHSHLNRDVTIEGVRYVNNAFGYPLETRIAAKRLLSIHET